MKRMKSIKVSEETYYLLKAENQFRKSTGTKQSFEDTTNNLLEQILIYASGYDEEELKQRQEILNKIQFKEIEKRLNKTPRPQ